MTDAENPRNAAAQTPGLDPADMERMWDERYADGGAVWSGQPNGALVAEAASLAPARVLDVGCGEGADAVWLARSGWDVTALDVSRVALRRAREAAAEAGVEVRWLHSGLVEAPLPTQGFELVAAMYPALMKTPDNDAERALLQAVAAGGTLLFVHHAKFGTQPDSVQSAPEATQVNPAGSGSSQGHRHGGREAHGHDGPAFSPRDLVGVEDVRRYLAAADGQWEIDTHEERPRDVQGGAGAHFTVDVVLTARRLA